MSGVEQSPDLQYPRRRQRQIFIRDRENSTIVAVSSKLPGATKVTQAHGSPKTLRRKEKFGRNISNQFLEHGVQSTTAVGKTFPRRAKRQNPENESCI